MGYSQFIAKSAKLRNMREVAVYENTGFCVAMKIPVYLKNTMCLYNRNQTKKEGNIGISLG